MNVDWELVLNTADKYPSHLDPTIWGYGPMENTKELGGQDYPWNFTKEDLLEYG